MKGDILIVDDVQANLRLLSTMLTEQGYKVRPVPSGEIALRTVAVAPPDLILLDINMPGLSGYEVCTRLKAGETTRDIPIIFLSALDDTTDKVRGFEVGGVDYITKPFQIREVLARIETHLSLRRYTIELEARNEELDAFAGMVAHDLRSPLTRIIATAQLLQAKHDVALGLDGTAAAQRIIDGSWHMTGIIDALLRLAHIRQEAPPALPLEMGKIVANALSRYELALPEANAEIVLPSEWPGAIGHGPWVEEVWANYVGNAVKYGGQAPVITLGATPLSAGEIRFFVNDQGPGIAPRDQEKLFTPFTRLHSDEKEGHGLGLSIVKRIVHKLGGAVGVESRAGAGTTFWFTLPAAVATIAQGDRLRL